jgi:BirA family transcriptional regulator, biotin operon repressor / biotin---[acetyl-CoA-carboxylase] ligase
MNNRAADTDIWNRSPWYHKTQVDSTNRYLMELPDTGIVNGITCSADIQTGGFGRRNRTWVSPPGGLYMSIVFVPEIDQKYWHLVSFVMGVAAAEAIAEQYPDCHPLLKWPNDILVSGCKIAGILVQSRCHPSPRLVAGIGINISTDPGLLPDRPLFPAGVLNRLSKHSTPVRHLAHSVRSRFFHHVIGWCEDPAGILQKWESFSAMQGARVTIQTDRAEHTGWYLGLLQDGGLRLRVENRIMTFHTGDILAIKGGNS